MFKFFQKSSESDRLNKEYKKLLDQAYRLSHINRKASDAKMAEAELISQKIAALRKAV